MFEIKKNIPIEGRYKKSPFPFDPMEVGDCFDVPFEQYKAQTVRNHISAFNKRNKDKIMKFKTYDDFIRVWRVE